VRAPQALRDKVQDANDQAQAIVEKCLCFNMFCFVRLGDLFRAGYVKILARWSHRAAVFSLPARKISSIKLLPAKQERL
jgi:hypothetical protein